MVIQDACGFLSGRRHRRDSQRQTAGVKRREAFTRANVGLSRAIGTTISFTTGYGGANLAPA